MLTSGHPEYVFQMVGDDDSVVVAERLTADGAEMWEDWRRGGVRFRKRYGRRYKCLKVAKMINKTLELSRWLTL